MGKPGLTIHLRLSPRLQRKLETIHANHFAGLPLATIGKLLLADQLQKPDEAILEIVLQQIRMPTKENEPSRPKARLPNPNARKPHSRH